MLALVLRLGVLARGFVSDDESIALVCPTELRERTCVGGPVFRRVCRANSCRAVAHAGVVVTGRLS